MREPEPIDSERKYVGRAELMEPALALLRQHCLPDPKHPVGTTESLYFDDPQCTSYSEKADGDNLKRKVRIRWYPDSVLPGDLRIPAFLEIKDRIGAGRRKIHQGFVADRHLLEQAPLADAGLVSLLALQLRQVDVPVVQGLRPSISVRYHRHRFVCPLTNARICLDSAVSSPRANEGWLVGGALESPWLVCEAKSPTYRAWPWSGPLCRIGFRSRSFSKYGEFMELRINRGIPR